MLKDLSAEAVETALEEYVEEAGEGEGWFLWKEMSYMISSKFYNEHTGWPNIEGVGTVEVLEDFGGEGQGDEYYLVFKITDTTKGGSFQGLGDLVTVRYFKMNGYYASYSGGTYDGPFEEVKPVTREVVFYE